MHFLNRGNKKEDMIIQRLDGVFKRDKEDTILEVKLKK
jgi:hypothetical protein